MIISIIFFFLHFFFFLPRRPYHECCEGNELSFHDEEGEKGGQSSRHYFFPTHIINILTSLEYYKKKLKYRTIQKLHKVPYISHIIAIKTMTTHQQYRRDFIMILFSTFSTFNRSRPRSVINKLIKSTS